MTRPRCEGGICLYRRGSEQPSVCVDCKRPCGHSYHVSSNTGMKCLDCGAVIRPFGDRIDAARALVRKKRDELEADWCSKVRRAIHGEMPTTEKVDPGMMCALAFGTFEGFEQAAALIFGALEGK